MPRRQRQVLTSVCGCGRRQATDALPTEARAALAESLLESLDTAVGEDAEVAWATEVNRRLAELDRGEVKTIPWPEARRRLGIR